MKYLGAVFKQTGICCRLVICTCLQKFNMKNKKNLKRKAAAKEVEQVVSLPPAVRQSDEPIAKKAKWVNKQRILILALRGITYINRHLMEDLRTLLPHCKKDSKIEKGVELNIVNEIAESKNCNKCILFENRRKTDLYMWVANIGNGPTIKFQVENIYTMKELKLTGNCLRGSRPLLSFDDSFQAEPQHRLMQELLVQIFGTPNHHPKSQPFTDHILSFTLLDGRIWFRNYQILAQDGALVEIGPRFVLNPIKIFAGSFGGEVLWDNPDYVSTSMFRRNLSRQKGERYLERKQQKEHTAATKPEISYKLPEIDVFENDDKEVRKGSFKPKNKKPKKGKKKFVKAK